MKKFYFVCLLYFFFTKIVHLSNIEPRLRIFCLILTTKKNLNSKALIVHETWANKCDNHTFISIIDNSNTKRKEIKHKNLFYVTQPKNFIEDTYKNLTDKILLSFQDVYENHNDYDWYLKADDDTFIFMDNLHDFLKDKNRNLPVTYGHNFKVKIEGGFQSGGAGYLVSNEAFKRISLSLKKDKDFCSKKSGIEDIEVRLCLKKLKVELGESVDHLNRERFHPTNFNAHFLDPPIWLNEYSKHPPQKVNHRSNLRSKFQN